MKTIIVSFLSLGVFGLLPGCTFVESREPATHSTTSTTTAEVTPTAYGTTETKITRSY